MNKFFTLCLSLFSFLALNAQQNPAVWSATYKSISATEGEIIIVAMLEKGWHTYSQRPTDAGPINTNITFPKSKDYTLVGKAEEAGAVEEFEKAFDAKVYSFSNKAEFHQKIKLNSKAGFSIPFKLEYICCNDNMCLPPKTIDLNVKTQ